MSIRRRSFYDPEFLVRKVRERVEEVRTSGGTIDYLCFVPDGEPTLDLNLGREIEALRPLGIAIGIISNASLVWNGALRRELKGADWVSLKVDAVDERIWKEIDRPHGKLDLGRILDGVLEFSENFRGRLVTETMLVRDLNDGTQALHELADFLGKLQPETAYLSIPLRPPAEENVRAPDEKAVTRAWSILSSRLERVECLVGAEGNDFFSTGRVGEDLLSITSVHPMRIEAVRELLSRSGVPFSIVEELLRSGRLVRTDFNGESFILRRL